MSCPCAIAFRSTRSFVAGSCKSGAIDIPPPRPKRKPSHPYPRKPDQGSPDSDTPTAWQVSPSRNAHLPRSFSRESLGTSAGCQPLHPAKSPFAQVQHEPTSMHGWKQQPQSQLPSRCSRDSKSPSNMQPHQGYTAPAPPSHEAVSAVAAAASAAAAAAAAAVIAAAGHDIQQQLQVCPLWTLAQPPSASIRVSVSIWGHLNAPWRLLLWLGLTTGAAACHYAACRHCPVLCSLAERSGARFKRQSLQLAALRL